MTVNVRCEIELADQLHQIRSLHERFKVHRMLEMIILSFKEWIFTSSSRCNENLDQENFLAYGTPETWGSRAINSILNLQVFFLDAEEDVVNVLDDKGNQLSKSEKLFKAGFLEARLQHIEALKHIRRTMNYEKQYKLTVQVFQKLFDILKQTKAILENSDYVPALNFPSNQTVIEALGQVLDNTALYGEFQLKLPDITDRIMQSHNEWMVLIKWAIGFSNSTGLYDAKTTGMLNLVCQDMNLIERTENFINPYRSKPSSEVPISKPKETSSKKKVFKKGPRMSRNFHTEL